MTQPNSAHPVTADRFARARNELILRAAPMKRVYCERCNASGVKHGGWCEDCLGMGIIYRAVALLLLMMLCAAPGHALSLFHHRSKVDRAFVSETVSELKDAALIVGLYQRYPPLLTDPKADVLYIQRAEADLAVAIDALRKYRHHSLTKQDVETVMSQLSRDLEDIPPAKWPKLKPRDTV